MNLEKYKLGKNQLNQITGGKQAFQCHISAVEYGGGSFDAQIFANSWLEAEEIAQEHYGNMYYVSCI